MRISDWSSDVCSSDLTRRVAGRAAERGSRPARAGVGFAIGCASVFVAGVAIRTAAGALGRAQPRCRHGGGGCPAHIACCRRSEEHTSELQSLMRISYAVFCLKKKKKKL